VTRYFGELADSLAVAHRVAIQAAAFYHQRGQLVFHYDVFEVSHQP
jgi:hypothetical protein